MTLFDSILEIPTYYIVLLCSREVCKLSLLVNSKLELELRLDRAVGKKWMPIRGDVTDYGIYVDIVT